MVPSGAKCNCTVGQKKFCCAHGPKRMLNLCLASKVSTGFPCVVADVGIVTSGFGLEVDLTR